MDFAPDLFHSYETSSSAASVPSTAFDDEYENSSSHHHPEGTNPQIPHSGALARVEGGATVDDDIHYVLTIRVNSTTEQDGDDDDENEILEEERLFESDHESDGEEAEGANNNTPSKKKSASDHELIFQRHDFDFAVRLFAIMDTESKCQISRATVKEFVTLRCPVFWRRDIDLRKAQSRSVASSSSSSSPTFDEVWKAVVTCSKTGHMLDPEDDEEELNAVEIGLEAWMVFCRFIALAQYLEAKRRFSGRHLQQTMRQRNAARGSEMVVVDVPPPAPPVALSPQQLAQYEREGRCLPSPELDLDHSLLAAHDVLKRKKTSWTTQGRVKVDLFGGTSSKSSSPDFCITYARDMEEDADDNVTVRRSIADMKWLNDTFVSHKTLGGTLCGRILPPFPGSGSRTLASHFHSEDPSQSTSETAIAAASAGVGIIKDGIKSLWGTYSKKSGSSSSPKKGGSSGKSSSSKSLALPESYYNPSSAEGKARHLERYLNYLLEHPALSTSFPLNTILKASQSGLEAAKQSIEECARASKEIKEQTPHLEDGKLLSAWLRHGSGLSPANLSWVRTAAQAAMALQLHGILETTGMQSASARLQQASLPSFENSRATVWNDEEIEARFSSESEEAGETQGQDSFEDGVEQVSDELEADLSDDDGVGYDLLPLPVPPPERRILTVGDASSPSGDSQEARFRYGSPILASALPVHDEDDGRPALIGDIAVDENIDKLREVIGSVDNTLSRCLASSGGIGRARRERNEIHLDILRGLDSYEGLRGKFVNQRALLKGVSGIEQSKDVFDESDLSMIDDISWQTALATSAVSAAEDVRSAVRAARTASNARASASSAAMKAQYACENGNFRNIDEARAAQTRSSIAQSHALHSAVVEHEAKTVKRRATLALAHDVKSWNDHRKREVLQTCLAYAKSQHEATRRAVDAWSCLRDGYVGSPVIPSTHGRKPPPVVHREDSDTEPFTSIYADDTDEGVSPTIVAVEHDLLKQPEGSSTPPRNGSSGSEGDEILAAPSSPETLLPMAMASRIPEEEGEDDDSSGAIAREFGSSLHSQSCYSRHSSAMGGSLGSRAFSAGSPGSQSRSKLDGGDDEPMTSSMQSLVNGLMTWGGQYDSEEDFALPTGMAASIALEESAIFGPQNIE